MRSLLFFCVPVLAFSQTSFISLLDFRLRDYLKLTATQVEQLERNFQDTQRLQAPAATRLNIVNQEIATETRKASPSAVELGLRYQELETICRELDSPRLAAHQRQLQLLNDEQRTLLAALGDAKKLAPLSSSAAAFFLIPRTASPAGLLELPSVYNGMSYQGPPSSSLLQSVPVDLALYLNLTPTQVDRIQAGILTYQRLFSARFSRSTEVSLELEAEFGRELPNPKDLGDRYLEIELLRRQIAERETALRTEFSVILSPVQRTLTQALEQAQARTQLALAAEQYQLLPPNSGLRPASRASMGQLLINSLISPRTGSTPSLALLPTQTIYRGCEGGPDFAYALGIFDLGGAPQSMRQ